MTNCKSCGQLMSESEKHCSACGRENEMVQSKKEQATKNILQDISGEKDFASISTLYEDVDNNTSNSLDNSSMNNRKF